jgi:hypothetical protein
MTVTGVGSSTGRGPASMPGHAHLVDDANLKVVHHAYLARESGVVTEIGLRGKDRLFGISDRTRIAADDLNPTRSASRVAAAAVEDVNSSVFERKDELAVSFSFDRHLSIGRIGHNYMHQEFSLNFSILDN